jgi:predicted ArsR family transcriptional regulator
VSEFDPEPSAATLSEEQAVWTETEDTRRRIQAVIIGLQEPAPVTTIADRAACSENAARKHLKDFASLGVVDQVDDASGTRYVRNEAYIRWQRANRLATANTAEELLTTLAELEDQDEQYQVKFDEPTPEMVDLSAELTHADLEERLEELSEWATVRTSIDRHKEAVRIARRTDDRLTA